jgi:hypothetical protein
VPNGSNSFRIRWVRGYWSYCIAQQKNSALCIFIQRTNCLYCPFGRLFEVLVTKAVSMQPLKRKFPDTLAKYTAPHPPILRIKRKGRLMLYSVRQGLRVGCPPSPDRKQTGPHLSTCPEERGMSQHATNRCIHTGQTQRPLQLNSSYLVFSAVLYFVAG